MYSQRNSRVYVRRATMQSCSLAVQCLMCWYSTEKTIDDSVSNSLYRLSTHNRNHQTYVPCLYPYIPWYLMLGLLSRPFNVQRSTMQAAVAVAETCDL